MARFTTPTALVALLLAAGCSAKDEPFPVHSGGGSDDDEDTDVTDDTASGDDTGDPGTEDDTPYFEAPGDTVTFQDDDGDAEIDLSDRSESPGSNQDQEFFLVIVNTGSDDLGYQLRYDVPSEEDTGDAGAEGPAPRAARPAPPRTRAHASAFRQNLRNARAASRLSNVQPPAAPPPPLETSDVGVARQEFRVRDSLTDDSSFDLVDAKLWALGDTVAIWVDDDVAIDWDYECDGVVDVADSRNAYGFDNCDLQVIADIVDTNIVPNVRALYGFESDENGDGKISVVITPVLNYMTQFSDEEDVAGSLVGSYADPEVDLTEFDVQDNPMSDEQEVIYVHAPDPYGFLNAFSPVTIEAYTDVGLASEIARAFTRLVVYNNMVLGDGPGEMQQTWVVEGLAALAADVTGFGSVNYPAVWDYLDAPHLYSLVVEDDVSAISSGSVWGAQYLFFRWLHETQESTNTDYDSIFQEILVSNPGSEGIASVCGSTMEELVVQWQVALLTTGVTDSEGNPLLDEASPDNEDELRWPPYAEATTATAPTENPSSGDFYGANGYQLGVNVRGVNVTMEGGTTTTPTEDYDSRVTTSGTDYLTMVTGFPFYGSVAGDYGAQVVRLADIPFDQAALVIDAAGNGYEGVVVRWTDPTRENTAVEDIFSSTDANSLTLPALPSDGEPIWAVGNILPPGATQLVTEDGEPDTKTIYDTDRWLLDLTSRPAGVPVTVVIELTRHYEDTDGDLGLYDPWFAVVQKNLVPTPTVTGTTSASCPSGPSFGYPTTVLEYLASQVFLSPYSHVDADGDEITEENFSGGGDDTGDAGGASGLWDPCGTQSSGTTCAVDWDLDGVANSDEPVPESFLQQVQVMQCTLAGGDYMAVLNGGGFYTPEIIDSDSRDEDDVAFYDRVRNLGGRSGEEGEEAYMQLDLLGGGQYVIVVGGETDTGVYELMIRELID